MSTLVLSLIIQMLITAQVFAGETQPPGGETPSPAREFEVADPISAVLKSKEYKESYQLPIEGLIIVQSGNKTYLLSTNARFLIRGQIYDLWNSTFINTVEDARKFSDRIQISKLKLDLSTLSSFVSGSGKQEVIAFIDPNCPYCHKLLEQIEKLGKDYRFRLVLIPMLGERSGHAIKRLMCGIDGKNRDKKAVAYLLSGKYDELPDKECNMEPLVGSMFVAKLLGIQGVPFMISPDGRVLRGYTEDLKQWLQQKS